MNTLKKLPLALVYLLAGLILIVAASGVRWGLTGALMGAGFAFILLSSLEAAGGDD